MGVACVVWVAVVGCDVVCVVAIVDSCPNVCDVAVCTVVVVCTVGCVVACDAAIVDAKAFCAVVTVDGVEVMEEL